MWLNRTQENGNLSQANARDALKLKLQSMESKLINGGDVIEKTAIMEKELQEKQRSVFVKSLH